MKKAVKILLYVFFVIYCLALVKFLLLDGRYSRREPNSYALRREFFASFAKSHLARCVSCFDSL